MATTISASGMSDANFSAKHSFSTSTCGRKAFYEGGHQLEKLEFALAVAVTRGDQKLSASLRDQIAELGGNIEEPGT